MESGAATFYESVAAQTYFVFAKQYGMKPEKT